VDVTAAMSGYLAATNCMELEFAGDARRWPRDEEDKIDHGVGWSFNKRLATAWRRANRW